MIENLLEPLICSRFIEDAKYREGHVRIINPLPGRKIMGLHVPDMKSFAKELVRSGNAAEVVSGFERLCSERGYADRSALCHEELMVWGFMINYMKVSETLRYRMVERFVPAIDNWAVCDSFCSSAKWMKKADGDVLWNFLHTYCSSDKEFHVRFALISYMSYFLEERWLDRMFDMVESVNYPQIKSEYTLLKSPYYVRMGSAWLLATALAKFPERTRAFVSRPTVPDDVRKLYVRKARESFRTRDIQPL